jgi:hypothetical protein
MTVWEEEISFALVDERWRFLGRLGSTSLA